MILSVGTEGEKEIERREEKKEDGREREGEERE